MFRKLLRKPYRKALMAVTAATINKHKPNVVAVIGNGQTSIARELIYNVLKYKYPTRRNLETPEAEFSVPLTALGYTRYPKNFVEWFNVLAKSYFQLKSSKPYQHFLVIELNFQIPELMIDWLKVLKPEVLFITGSVNFDYTPLEIRKVVKISVPETSDIITPFKIGVQQVARFYAIDDADVEKAFDPAALPVSKIRYLPGANGSIVIDATHYYFPIKIESVFELIDPEMDRVFIFTDLSEDYKYIDGKENIMLNASDFSPQKNDLIILRGSRTKVLHKFENILGESISLI